MLVLIVGSGIGGLAAAGTTQAKSDALALCRSWMPLIPRIVERTPVAAVLRKDIVDRAPLRWWGRGAVTLLGDAAHATTPNLGQGACQALEDAVVLAHCLRAGGRTVDTALRECERQRIPSARGGTAKRLFEEASVRPTWVATASEIEYPGGNWRCTWRRFGRH